MMRGRGAGKRPTEEGAGTEKLNNLPKRVKRPLHSTCFARTPLVNVQPQRGRTGLLHPSLPHSSHNATLSRLGELQSPASTLSLCPHANATRVSQGGPVHKNPSELNVCKSS